MILFKMVLLLVYVLIVVSLWMLMETHVLAVTIHHVFVKPVVLVHVMVHVKVTED